MAEFYTGVKTHKVKSELIDDLYNKKEIELETIGDSKKWPQNIYVVLKDDSKGKQSAITRVKNDKLVLLDSNISASTLKPRNKEQSMSLDALMDDDVPVVLLTGRAGSGKTLLSTAVAVQKIQDKKYNRIILSKPMSSVDKQGLGYLPGDIDQKFHPYLENYFCNFEYMMGGDRKKVQDLVDQARIDFVPISVIRGASWINSFVIMDEAQTLTAHEMVTLGTRLGEGSKLVILGDLNQRDERIAKERTGMYKFINHSLTKSSKLVASIDLVKCERSETAALFADVFGV